MKKASLLAIVVIAAAGAAQADERWNGFYRGIDHRDGGIATLSITTNQDGSFHIVASGSSLTYCDGGPGGIRGVGRIENDALIREQTQVYCSGSDDPQEISDATYMYDGINDVLRFETPGGRSIIYHRLD